MALLFQFFVVQKRPAVREHAFLHADDKHDRELQSFCAVHRHKNDGIGLILVFVVHRIDVGNERQIREEGNQRLVFVAFFEFHRNGQELVDVLEARPRFDRVFALHFDAVFAHLQHFFGELRDG